MFTQLSKTEKRVKRIINKLKWFNIIKEWELKQYTTIHLSEAEKYKKKWIQVFLLTQFLKRQSSLNDEIKKLCLWMKG